MRVWLLVLAVGLLTAPALAQQPPSSAAPPAASPDAFAGYVGALNGQLDGLKRQLETMVALYQRLADDNAKLKQELATAKTPTNPPKPSK